MNGRLLLVGCTLASLAAASCTRSAADDVRGGSVTAGESGAAPASAVESHLPEPAWTPLRLPGPHRPWVISEIGPEHRAVLVPRNWRAGCPVPLSDLRWLTVRYWGFDGEPHLGPLIVNERVAEDVRWVFQQLFREGFQIQRITLPRRYRPTADRWDDTHNVTSAFNCRPVTDNPDSWSHHSFGWAVDINPLQNPYVRADGSVLRKAAKPYRDRSLTEPGMILEGDVVARSFAAIGWGWGGHWSSLKDYMHFSLTGR